MRTPHRAVPVPHVQIIESCIKKLKDLNKPFKYIGARYALRRHLFASAGSPRQRAAHAPL